MRLLLVRHGKAVQGRIAGGDAQRWLTDEGRRRVRRVRAGLEREGLELHRAFSSPLVRAVQTTELLVANTECPVTMWPALAGGTTAEALSCLDSVDDSETVALVGHAPSISAMAAHLIGVSSFPGFGPGTACCIDWRGDSGSFQWLLDARTEQRITTIDELTP